MGKVRIQIPDISEATHFNSFLVDIPHSRTPMSCLMRLLLNMNSPVTSENLHRLLAVNYKVYYYKNSDKEIIQSIDCEDIQVENGSTLEFLHEDWAHTSRVSPLPGGCLTVPCLDFNKGCRLFQDECTNFRAAMEKNITGLQEAEAAKTITITFEQTREGKLPQQHHLAKDTTVRQFLSFVGVGSIADHTVYLNGADVTHMIDERCMSDGETLRLDTTTIPIHLIFQPGAMITVEASREMSVTGWLRKNDLLDNPHYKLMAVYTSFKWKGWNTSGEEWINNSLTILENLAKPGALTESGLLHAMLCKDMVLVMRYSKDEEINEVHRDVPTVARRTIAWRE